MVVCITRYNINTITGISIADTVVLNRKTLILSGLDQKLYEVSL